MEDSLLRSTAHEINEREKQIEMENLLNHKQDEFV